MQPGMTTMTQSLSLDKPEVYMHQEKVYVVVEDGKSLVGRTHYPMEGRLSADRILDLTYWDVSGYTISGTVSLRVAPSGRRMVGRWQGYTITRERMDTDVDLYPVTGRVIWSRDGFVE